MSLLTESFANLTEMLQTDHARSSEPGQRTSDRERLLSRLLRPFLPASIRCGPGTLFDIKDRQSGPFDVVAAWEAYPPLGEGAATLYPVDGVVFCLQARNWASEDLTQFASLASQVRKLERRSARPVFCAAVSFDLLSMDQLLDFLKSPAGQSVDGVLCVGHNVVIRNAQGWYGDSERIPFVTERGGAEALKAFTLCLVQQAQSFIGLPFGLADYQHL